MPPPAASAVNPFHNNSFAALLLAASLSNPWQGHQQDLDIRLDQASIEIFALGGRLSMTSLIFPNRPYTQVQLTGDKAFTLEDYP